MKRLLGALCLTTAVAAYSAANAWEKPGVSEAEVERDADDCWFEAQGRSMIEAAHDDLGEVFIGDFGGRRLTFHVPGASALQFLRQRDFFKRCMDDRGYIEETADPVAGEPPTDAVTPEEQCCERG